MTIRDAKFRCAHNGFEILGLSAAVRSQLRHHAIDDWKIGPQSLSAKKVRDESVTLLNDAKRCKRLRTQVWSGHIGPYS